MSKSVKIMNPFTAIMVAAGKRQYESMCKSFANGGSGNKSIHRKIVEGKDHPYHGHLV